MFRLLFAGLTAAFVFKFIDPAKDIPQALEYPFLKQFVSWMPHRQKVSVFDAVRRETPGMTGNTSHSNRRRSGLFDTF